MRCKISCLYNTWVKMLWLSNIILAQYSSKFRNKCFIRLKRNSVIWRQYYLKKKTLLISYKIITTAKLVIQQQLGRKRIVKQGHKVHILKKNKRLINQSQKSSRTLKMRTCMGKIQLLLIITKVFNNINQDIKVVWHRKITFKAVCWQHSQTEEEDPLIITQMPITASWVQLRAPSIFPEAFEPPLTLPQPVRLIIWFIKMEFEIKTTIQIVGMFKICRTFKSSRIWWHTRKNRVLGVRPTKSYRATIFKT